MEKKVYTKKSEKVIDFLIGFFGIPIVLSAIIGISSLICNFLKFNYSILPVTNTIVSLLAVIFIMYLARKRKYVGIGLLYILVIVPLALLGTCFLVINGSDILSKLFRR